ncbi:MAG TPA: FtsW/RodA/SpoVE family cell cycle protein [Ilumatobacteraceae bacterium]|nr:FtsW/RodA/SpoVE family cell cycle protein [Ilumatobacteraceae bacterium]
MPQPRYLMPLLAAWAFAVVVMVGQKDLGSSLLFFTLFVVMVWVATERIGFLILGLLLFAGAAYLSYRLFGHVKTRVDIWIDPWSRYSDGRGDRGRQIVEAAFAIGDGGLTGAGLGQGLPTRVPAVSTDFIFAAIGEELGLLGSSLVLMGFLLIVGAGLRIAIRAERPFEKLLATGLTALLGVQAFIIIGGVIRVVPLTGITLPFVSYGGSSLVANYIILALLMRVSDSTSRRLGELPDEPTINERFAAWRLRRSLRAQDKRAAKAGARAAGQAPTR